MSATLVRALPISDYPDDFQVTTVYLGDVADGAGLTAPILYADRDLVIDSIRVTQTGTNGDDPSYIFFSHTAPVSDWQPDTYEDWGNLVLGQNETGEVTLDTINVLLTGRVLMVDLNNTFFSFTTGEGSSASSSSEAIGSGDLPAGFTASSGGADDIMIQIRWRSRVQ